MIVNSYVVQKDGKEVLIERIAIEDERGISLYGYNSNETLNFFEGVLRVKQGESLRIEVAE